MVELEYSGMIGIFEVIAKQGDTIISCPQCGCTLTLSNQKGQV